MTDQQRSLGKTTIAPDVLTTIVRLTVLGIPGVSKMAPVSGSVDRWLKSGASEGVIISVENNIVYADIYVVLRRDVNVRDVGRLIQSKVTRAISEMVGMEVGKINVHIEDIDYSPEEVVR